MTNLSGIYQEESGDECVPEGYRMTELGVIPEGWEVKNIGNIAPLQRGFDLPNNELEKGEYPVVYSNGIVNYHCKYKVRAPGVVTGRSGTIGKVTFVDVDYRNSSFFNPYITLPII